MKTNMTSSAKAPKGPVLDGSATLLCMATKMSSHLRNHTSQRQLN